MQIGKKMIPGAWIIKLASTIVMGIVMGAFAPAVLLHRPLVPVLVQSQELGERVTNNEARLANLERRMDAYDGQHVMEQLAEIRTRQEGVLLLLMPIAIFIITHTFEVVQRIRGKLPPQ